MTTDGSTRDHHNHQEIENVAMISGERSDQEITTNNINNNQSTSSNDGSGDQDEDQIIVSNDDYSEAEERPLLDEDVDQETATYYISLLERFLGRSWTLDDTMRNIHRSLRVIYDNRGADRASRITRTYEEIVAIRHLVISEDIDYLVARGDLSPRILNDSNNWEVLYFSYIRFLGELGNVARLLRIVLSSIQEWATNLGLSEEIISKCLKTRICEEDKKIGEDDEICVVCHDDLYQRHGKIGIVECGHEYHFDCIKRWLQEKNICPLCRAEAIHVDDDNEDRVRETGN